jgi:hypothetical protein
MNEQELDGRRVRVGLICNALCISLTKRSTWPTPSPLVVVTVDPATTLVTEEVAVVTVVVDKVVTEVARAVVSTLTVDF